MSDVTPSIGIRETPEYAAILAEMRSWDGRLEQHGTAGLDMFGRERHWIMCAYELWAEKMARAVLDQQNGSSGGRE